MRKILIGVVAAAALSATGSATAPASAETCYVAGIDYCEIRDGIRDPILHAVCDLTEPGVGDLGVVRCPH